MSTRDLQQKLELRRVFWAMGGSTRLEVKLGALVFRQQGRADRQEWTDVDVLAVHYAPLTGLTYVLADCKTSRTRVAERIFWLRGVMDVLGARSGYLVREGPLPPASRQLALRLGIAAMDAADRAALIEQTDITELPNAETFFDGSSLEKWTLLTAHLPRELDRFSRYRETGYWIAPGHRNLTVLPSQLGTIRSHLRHQDSWAMVLVLDLAWLYLVALLRAVEDMVRVHLSDLGAGLAQVVVGDERERRDKQFLADQLERLFQALPAKGQRIPPVELLPGYYDDLADLAYRVARRRTQATSALRVLEFVGVESIAGMGKSWRDASPSSDPLAVKLASDVVRFLRRAARLESGFEDTFDRLTSPDATTETRPDHEVTPRETNDSDEGRQMGIFSEPTKRVQEADPK
jgi:hypothetical protein